MWKDNLLLPGNKGVRSGVAVIMACIGAGGGGEEGREGRGGEGRGVGGVRTWTEKRNGRGGGEREGVRRNEGRGRGNRMEAIT